MSVDSFIEKHKCKECDKFNYDETFNEEYCLLYGYFIREMQDILKDVNKCPGVKIVDPGDDF